MLYSPFNGIILRFTEGMKSVLVHFLIFLSLVPKVSCFLSSSRKKMYVDLFYYCSPELLLALLREYARKYRYLQEFVVVFFFFFTACKSTGYRSTLLH